MSARWHETRGGDTDRDAFDLPPRVSRVAPSEVIAVIVATFAVGYLTGRLLAWALRQLIEVIV